MVPWGKRFLPWSFWPCGTCSSLLCWLLCFVTVFRPCPSSHALCQVLPPSPLPLLLPLLSCLHPDLRSELTGAPTGVRDLREHLVAEFTVLRNPQSGLGVGTEKGLSQCLLRAQASPFSDLVTLVLSAQAQDLPCSAAGVHVSWGWAVSPQAPCL